ncbi:hypothetical protein R1sor_020244 [Riccia sorocarpa]|uniref:methylated diphthine methylhydrolase n=1 Tax=Riccia sorocarpa TaxID=122646 RepID=A0ABD3IJ95_9MARC
MDGYRFLRKYRATSKISSNELSGIRRGLSSREITGSKRRMARVNLIGNADAAEFCPCDPYLNIVAAASYTLQEGDQPVRLGELYLFSVHKLSNVSNSSTNLTLKQVYHRETSGVFDLKWRPWTDRASNPCLAQASADGTLRLHTLEESENAAMSSSSSSSSGLNLREISSTQISSSMCLYVDWIPSSGSESPQVAVSHSDGSLSVIDVGQAEPECISSWDAHGFEAWVVAYDNWKPQILFSGGDDSQFCCWDLRDTQRPVFRDRRTHQMGVCSIQSSPLLENVLVTGSYDENIRVWDLRMTYKPLMQAELGLGGGVWRLKWHHRDSGLLLAACMHNGFAVARVGGAEIEVLERYEEHKSLAYGGSWYRGDWEQSWSRETGSSPQSTDLAGRMLEGLTIAGEETGQTKALEEKIPESRGSRGSTCLVATCSFYDKALHIWEPKTLASGF